MQTFSVSSMAACRNLRGIELPRALFHGAAHGGGHGEADVGIDVHLAHAVADAFLDLRHRDAVGLANVAAVAADFLQQILRHRGGAVHDQVRVGQAGVDRLDALDGEHVAGRLALELVGAVRRADGDRQRVALRLIDEARRLVGIGQELRRATACLRRRGRPPCRRLSVSSEPRQPSSPSTETPTACASSTTLRVTATL